MYTDHAQKSITTTIQPTTRPPVFLNRSLTVDEDYFERRSLRLICTLQSPSGSEDFPFLPQASEIIPGLYLADMYTATSPAVLSRLGITHVVSVVREPWYRYPREVRQLCIPIEDTPFSNIVGHFDTTTAWIQRALTQKGSGLDSVPPEDSAKDAKDAKVLVHCMWGMSRSASIIVAYIMATRKMTLQSALNFVKARRSVIRPNRGFLAQLGLFQQRLEQRERLAQREKRRISKNAARS